MARLTLVHWNDAELRPLVAELAAAGHAVEGFAEDGASAWKAITARPPEALVVSMRRLPSHGRRVAAATREKKALRHLPVIFFDLKPDDVDRTRSEFPDATIVSWDEVVTVLARLV